jgi:hypothetical protein
MLPLSQSTTVSITSVEDLSSEDAAEFEERITTRKAKMAGFNVPDAPNSSALNHRRRSIHPPKKLDL